MFLTFREVHTKRRKWFIFPHVAQERSKLIWAYYQPHKIPLYEKAKHIWQKDDLINIMKLSAASPGFVCYEDLCDKFLEF